jgi:hypothetical protein
MSTQPLIVVPPLTITDAMIVSTNVAETDHAAWAAGTTYAIGNRVILVSTHSIYESVTAGNIGNNPNTSPANWIRVSPTNRWKLFDGSNSTQTKQASTISYRLRPGVALSALALLNLTDALSVRVQMIDTVYGTVYDQTRDLSYLPAVSEWWSWYFGARTARSLGLFLDLPSVPTADIYVDITGGSGLGVGVLLLGQAKSIGLGVTHGARLGIQDYSRKETNDFGDVVVVERAFAKRASFLVPIRLGEVDTTLELLAALRTTPCLWVGSPGIGAATVFGFYKDADVLINYGSIAECSLEIEGLT